MSNYLKFIVISTIIILCLGTFTASAESYETSGGTGPFVDKIYYDIITPVDEQVLALQDNNIDLIGDYVDPSFYDQLNQTSNIELENTLRNGYGYITINTAKYPFNITSFRRAFSFALDKNAISTDIWDSFSEPCDSLIPKINPFSVESQLSYSYYDANIAIANQLLDAAGFGDVDSDNIREAPDGTEFDVVIEAAQSSSIAIEVAMKAEEALTALNISATAVPTDFYEYLNRLYFHEDYDMAFLGSSFGNFDVDWMAYEYWSEYADEPYYNFPNWQNATYDSWRDQLLYSTSYSDVYDAAIEMQKIWIYDCPMVICYENEYINAYRTDTFEGFTNDVVNGVKGWWTNQKVSLISGGPIGGTLRRSLALDIDTFNPLVTNSLYTEHVLDELYDSLFRRDPDGNLMNWLADSYLIETHADNALVPSGHTRITIDLVKNATWTDGRPLSARDVAFTFNYLNEHGLTQATPYTSDLYAAYSLTDYRFIVEFKSESYWHFSHIAEIPILPKHIWSLQDPTSYNPDYTEVVSSGPFYVSDHSPGNYIELTRNPYYFKLPSEAEGTGTPPSVPAAISPESEPDEPITDVEAKWTTIVDGMSADEKLDSYLNDFLNFKELSQDVVKRRDGSISIIALLKRDANPFDIEGFNEIQWAAELGPIQMVLASFDSSKDLDFLVANDNVIKLSADVYLSKSLDNSNPPLDSGLDMFKINDELGVTAVHQMGYDGSGVVVGVDDTGVDFSQPDLQDAMYIDGLGYPTSFDPTSYGITKMVIANATAVADVQTWLDDGNLLTYESGGKVYLNVTSWDPICNNQATESNLLSFFIDAYANAYGIENISEFVYDQMWKDWELPSVTTQDYRVGWVFQQRMEEYAKIFAPSIIVNGTEVVIDWNGTKAWTKMWNNVIHYETEDINNSTIQYYYTDLMDWSFVDDINEGHEYTVTGNPIFAADLDDNGIDDIGLGSFSWSYDSQAYATDVTDYLYCGVSSNGRAFSLMFPSDTNHGHWCSAAIASRGEVDHNVYENGTLYKLPGVANGSKLIVSKGLTSGANIGSQFWAAGFHYNATSSYWEYTSEGQRHKADIISNSWGYVNGGYLDLTYLTLFWDLMSAPGVVDPFYPGTLFLFAEGNSGADYMTGGAPGDAASVVAVGAAMTPHYYEHAFGPFQEIGQQISFSSNGPSYTGISKPDIMAPGFRGANPDSFHNVWTGVGESYLWWQGTSLACPIAAGAAALILDAIETNWGGWIYNPVTLKEILISSATDMGLDAFAQGHGLIDVESAVLFIESNQSNQYFIHTEDSFENYMSDMYQAWDYWMIDCDPFGVYSDGTKPVGQGTSSIYFGSVYPGSSSEVFLSTFSYDGLIRNITNFDNVEGWYYRRSHQYTFNTTTFLYEDLAFGDSVERYGYYNLTEELGYTAIQNMLNAPYATINVHFDEANMDFISSARLFDWDDTIDDDTMNYYNTTYSDGDLLQLLGWDYNHCNNKWIRVAHPSGLSNVFDYTPTLVVADSSASLGNGNPIHITVTLWEKVLDTNILVAPGSAGKINVTLDLPNNAENGIHQGFLHLESISSGYSHNIPYSYMVIENIAEIDGSEHIVANAVGNEMTPYESGSLSASFDIDSTAKCDWGGARTFKVNISNPSAQYLIMDVEWQNEGTVIDVYLRSPTYNLLVSSEDNWDSGYHPEPTGSTKNVIIYDGGGSIEGTYYVEIAVHKFNGSVAFENVSVSLSCYDTLPTGSVSPEWTSNDSPTPQPVTDNDLLTGDHIVFENTWSITQPPSLPEYDITSSSIHFVTGIYEVRTGTYVDPQGYDQWPIPLSETSIYVWEGIKGIRAYDSVRVTLHANGLDPSFEVYEWWDSNLDDIVTLDEIGVSAFISVDDGDADVDEYGQFTADHNMDIAIVVFNWAWAYQSGVDYSLEVDTRSTLKIENTEKNLSYDTYYLGNNGTRDVHLYGYTDTNVEFYVEINNVTFNNYFVPDISLSSPNGGEVWTGTNSINWTASSGNPSDYDPIYDILISNDGGATYELLASNVSTSPYSWDCDPWQYMTNYSIIIRVTDRNMVNQDESDTTFTAGSAATPLVTPFIFGGGDQTFNLGEIGRELKWCISDLHPGTINLYIDDVLDSTWVWLDVVNVTTISLDSLTQGEYNYTIQAIDSDGLVTIQTSIVTVLGDAPIIDHPDDITYEFGNATVYLTWTPLESSPSVYEVYRDSTFVEGGVWDGSSITINVGGLTEGTYEFMCFVNNTDGKSVTDNVTVYVIPDTTAPDIDSPEDVTYSEGSSGNSIIWTPEDFNPSLYTVYLDGSTYVNGLWNSSSESISVDIDGLALGDYNFTLVVEDTYGNTASDIVWVTVVDGTPPAIEGPADYSYNEGTTGHVLKWNFSDSHPNTFTLYRNGSIIQSGTWTGTSSSLEASIDFLQIGRYNFTLVVTDDYDNVASDSVWVDVNDVTNPEVDSPEDITYTEGETGNEIVWTPTDAHPGDYTVTRNGTIVQMGNWASGVGITVDVDDLLPGVYVFNITVRDSSGNIASDHVLVTVEEAGTTSQTSTTDTTSDTSTVDPGEMDTMTVVISLVITIGSIVIIIYFIVKIYRSSQASDWESMMGS